MGCKVAAEFSILYLFIFLCRGKFHSIRRRHIRPEKLYFATKTKYVSVQWPLQHSGFCCAVIRIC